MKHLLTITLFILANTLYSQELSFSTYVNFNFDNLGDTINFSKPNKTVLVQYLTKTIDSSELILGSPKRWNSSAPCNACYITPDYRLISFDGFQDRLFYKDDTLTYLRDFGKKNKNNEYIYDKETGDLILELKWTKDNLANIIHSINTIEHWTYKDFKLKKNNLISNLKYKYFFKFDSSFFIGNLFSLKHKKQPIQKDTCFQKNINYKIYFGKNKLDNQQTQNYRNLIQAPLIDIEQNELEVYSILENKKVDVKTFFNYLIIDKLIPKRDENDELIYNASGDQFYDFEKSYLQLQDIIGLSFDENWYFDKNQFNIIKEVNSISFLVKKPVKLTGIKNEFLMPFKIKFNH